MSFNNKIKFYIIYSFRSLHRVGLKTCSQIQLRFSSKDVTNSSSLSVKEEWRKRRNVIFDNELNRLEHESGRLEKIVVKYYPPSPEDKAIDMQMNKNLSTPSDCAKHVSKDIFQTGAIALVDGQAWDMNKPFVESCELKILTMKMPDRLPSINAAFWRTCSFLLGTMIESSFKDEIPLYLHR